MCPVAAPQGGPGAATQPATPTPPPDQQEAFAGGPRRRWGRTIIVVVAALLVTGAGVGTFAYLRTGESGSTTPSASPPAPIQAPRIPFAFHVDVARAATLKTRPAMTVARQTADVIAGSLSVFYDRAFADPESWKNGLPDEAWAMFDHSVRDQAKDDAGSFTPDVTGVDLVRMDVTTSKLVVTVLVGPTGHPQAAFAKVVFEGTGQIEGGQTVRVDNAVTFLFRLIGKEWLVAGYPKATTKVETGTSSPSPSPASSP